MEDGGVEGGTTTNPGSSRAQGRPPERVAFRAGPAAPPPFDDSEVGTLLRDLLGTMSMPGPSGTDRYLHSLARVRTRCQEAVSALDTALRQVSTDEYTTRWALVYIAAKLADRTAIPLLRAQALSPLPDRADGDAHHSALVEETLLRATAVEGLGDLAPREPDATDALYECLEQPSRTIRATAIQALLARSSDDSVRERIIRALPADQLDLLDLRTVAVRAMSRIEGAELHLSDAGARKDRGYTPPPPPPTVGGVHKPNIRLP